ncbi:MAG TPA: cytochrome P450 [Gemmatimonadales bacterium]
MTVLDLDDIFAPDAIADPHAWYARLREQDPVHWNERYQLWVITRYDDIVWMIRHHELFSSAVIKNDPRPPYPPVDPADLPLFEPVRQFRSEMLVEQDRPEHLAQRKVMRGFFTPKAMESWRPFIRNAVAELLDQVQPRGTMDVLTDLAAPLPVRIIVEMMGVPPEDRDLLRHLADKLLYLNRSEPHRLQPLTEGIEGLLAYVTPKVEERLARPRHDFISVLARGETLGAFTRHQVLVNTALLLFAGHETTMNLICNGTLAFLRHPAQWSRFRSDPAGLAEAATEECLRYDPPVKSTQRIAAQDVELRGKLIHKQDRIRWAISAANRDPAVFPDPDGFDIARQPNPHVAFGAGVHHCLGATLARIEGQEVFRALAERLPGLRLESEALEYQPSMQFRSLKALPVSWT